MWKRKKMHLCTHVNVWYLVTAAGKAAVFMTCIHKIVPLCYKTQLMSCYHSLSHLLSFSPLPSLHNAPPPPPPPPPSQVSSLLGDPSRLLMQKALSLRPPGLMPLGKGLLGDSPTGEQGRAGPPFSNDLLLLRTKETYSPSLMGVFVNPVFVKLVIFFSPIIVRASANFDTSCFCSVNESSTVL